MIWIGIGIGIIVGMVIGIAVIVWWIIRNWDNGGGKEILP